MCGRFSLTVGIETLAKHFELKQGVYLKPRYNIAPSNPIPIIKKPGEIDFLTWGFVARWMTQKPEKGFINARAETISQKPVFREAFRKRRCLIIMDGYYEWKQLPRLKQPYYIRRKDCAPIALAGIWEGETCAIITTCADPRLLEFHPRMPIILDPNIYSTWLDHSINPTIIETLLNPFQSEALEIYPVSTRMNDPLFEGLECIRSLS